VQQNILEKHPAANLKVYAVWYSTLAGDSRSAWHSGAMPDRRVTNLWDEDRVVSQWFSKYVVGDEAYLWDAYFLYGSDAQWENADTGPSALLSSGGTILGNYDQLQARVLPLLKGK
jgi:hypothetical protein